MSGTLLSISAWKYFAGKKCVYASIRMRRAAPLSVSVGDENVDERLLSAAHRIARPRERRRQLRVRLDALAVPAVQAHDLLERRRRRKIGEELPVVLAGRAILEHRERRTSHRAIARVVEYDREHRNRELVGDPMTYGGVREHVGAVADGRGHELVGTC